MSTARSILLIDDNPQVAQAVTLAFAVAGHRVETAASPEAAYSLQARRRYDAILLDLNFTGGETSGREGFACLARLLNDDRDAIVVVITAHSGIRIAVAAMQAGALDFVVKPWRNADLVARVEAAIGRSRSSGIAPAPAAPTTRPVRLLGESAAIVQLRAQIRRVAPTRASILIGGAPGSGRTLVATLIHRGSMENGAPCVTIDGRDVAAWDRIDAAEGTLILRGADELDDVTQARLLDRLQDAARLIAIVAAPDRLTGRLRARLATIELAVPGLAARGGDALLLARHFAAVAAERHGRRLPSFTAAAEALIGTLCWPDEVRGLAQAVERAVLLCEDGAIDATALAPRLAQAIAVHRPTAAAPLGVSLEDGERVMIEAALKRHHHNVSHAAAALGLSRQALYRRMARHGL